MLVQFNKLKRIYKEVEILSKQLTSITFYKPELEEQLKTLDDYRYLLSVVIDNINMYKKENLNEIINELMSTLKTIVKTIEKELE